MIPITLYVIDTCVMLIGVLEQRMQPIHIDAINSAFRAEDYIVATLLTVSAPRAWAIRAELPGQTGNRSDWTGLRLCLKMCCEMGIGDGIVLYSVAPWRFISDSAGFVGQAGALPENMHFLDLLEAPLPLSRLQMALCDALDSAEYHHNSLHDHLPSTVKYDNELYGLLVETHDEYMDHIQPSLMYAQDAFSSDLRQASGYLTELCHSERWSNFTNQVDELLSRNAKDYPVRWWIEYLVGSIYRIPSLNRRLKKAVQEESLPSSTAVDSSSRLALPERLFGLLLGEREKEYGDG